MTFHPDRPSARTALVTGGSGFVGGPLIRRLIEMGWQVRAIGRSEASRDSLAALGADPHAADLSDTAALERAMIGVDTVFHVAAHFRFWGPRRSFQAVNVDGTRNAIAAAGRASCNPPCAPRTERSRPAALSMLTSFCTVGTGRPVSSANCADDTRARFRPSASTSDMDPQWRAAALIVTTA